MEDFEDIWQRVRDAVRLDLVPDVADLEDLQNMYRAAKRDAELYQVKAAELEQELRGRGGRSW